MSILIFSHTFRTLFAHNKLQWRFLNTIFVIVKLKQ